MANQNRGKILLKKQGRDLWKKINFIDVPVKKIKTDITFNQIQNTFTIVFVCKDLFTQGDRKFDAFKINSQGFVRFQWQCIHSDKTTFLFVFQT